MKILHLIQLGLLVALLSSCAAPSDPEFMKQSSAAINGGLIATPSGAMMSPGLQNRNRVHPFFGAP